MCISTCFWADALAMARWARTARDFRGNFSSGRQMTWPPGYNKRSLSPTSLLRWCIAGTQRSVVKLMHPEQTASLTMAKGYLLRYFSSYGTHHEEHFSCKAMAINHFSNTIYTIQILHARNFLNKSSKWGWDKFTFQRMLYLNIILIYLFALGNLLFFCTFLSFYRLFGNTIWNTFLTVNFFALN